LPALRRGRGGRGAPARDRRRPAGPDHGPQRAPRVPQARGPAGLMRVDVMTSKVHAGVSWRARALLSGSKHEATEDTETHEAPGAAASPSFSEHPRRGLRRSLVTFSPSPSCVSVRFVPSCFSPLGQTELESTI